MGGTTGSLLLGAWCLLPAPRCLLLSKSHLLTLPIRDLPFCAARSGCTCDGHWSPKDVTPQSWDDQKWTDAHGNQAGYSSYSYKENVIDSALDVYWFVSFRCLSLAFRGFFRESLLICARTLDRVRVLAERIKAERDASSRKVLALPETWPHKLPKSQLDASEFMGSESMAQLSREDISTTPGLPSDAHLPGGVSDTYGQVSTYLQ